MCVVKYSNILSSHASEGSDRNKDLPNSTPEHRSLELDQQELDTCLQGVEEPVSGSVPSGCGSRDVSEQIEASMELVGPFLCELLMEHKSLLTRVLVGADGRQLISDGEAE